MKNIVIEADKNYAIILNTNGEFSRIKNKNYTVGQQIIYKRVKYSALASIAASLIIICLFAVSGYSAYYTPANYISVDINPSVQFTANRFDRIIDMQSFNDDGKIVLGKGQIKNKSVEDGIEKIIDISIELGYLSKDNNEVIIDVVGKNQKTLQTMKNKTQKYEADSIVIDIEQSDEAILELSKELGVSVGRTKAIYEYTNAYGGDVKENKEKLNNSSVSSIKKSEKPNAEVSKKDVTQTINTKDKKNKNKSLNNNKEETPKNKTNNGNGNKNNLEKEMPVLKEHKGDIKKDEKGSPDKPKKEKPEKPKKEKNNKSKGGKPNNKQKK